MAAAGDGGRREVQQVEEVLGTGVDRAEERRRLAARCGSGRGRCLSLANLAERYDILLKNETGPSGRGRGVGGWSRRARRPADVRVETRLCDPGARSVRIEGWRTSMNQVMTFRFARVSSRTRRSSMATPAMWG